MQWWVNPNSLAGESYFTVTLILGLLSAVTIGFVLSTKKNPTSALAWCVVVLLFPLFGPVLFLVFGEQHVRRPLTRKRKQLARFRKLFKGRHAHIEAKNEDDRSGTATISGADLFRLGRRVGGSPLLDGNLLRVFSGAEEAYAAMIADIRAAKHHVHLQSYIYQPDQTGRDFLNELAAKARTGVQARLLFDAMGSHRLKPGFLDPLHRDGGKSAAFLPVSLFRRRSQINLRNHRKILIVDGHVGYTGGLNIGEEHLGRAKRYGSWRDAHLRVEGAAVAALQLVFAEDWSFAAGEDLADDAFFPETPIAGSSRVQVIGSGPDRTLKGIREVYFAAIMRAQKRLWIASPYFVPDEAILDAICLAGYRGVDVRLLGLYHPDQWLPFFAARYYWNDVLDAGVKVFQYRPGFMHSKVVLVDDCWASIGSANLDNRSMHLNFELNCTTDDPEVLRKLEDDLERDFSHSVQLERHSYARRPISTQMLENAARLFSPIL